MQVPEKPTTSKSLKSTMMDDYPLTITHLLERSAKLFARVEIVSRLPDKSLHRYTYSDFYRRTKALAEMLVSLGLKQTDRVATLMWNHYVHLEAYFGISSAGGVYHTLNLRLHPSDIAYIVNHAEDRFLIVDSVLLPIFAKFSQDVKLDNVIIVHFGGVPVPQLQLKNGAQLDYEELLKQATGKFDFPLLDERSPAGMCYSSGTTGTPKGVIYSHRSIVMHSFGEALPDTFGFSHHDVVLPVVPMFHANAWGLPFTSTMVGAKQVYPGPHLDPESLLDLMEREKVTLAGGVPTIWFAILQALSKGAKRWTLSPGLRLPVGGSAAPESLIRGFDKFGIRVIHAWGMTETTPLGTVSNLKAHMKEGLSEDEKYSIRAKQGIPPPFVEIRVVNEGGEVPWDGRTMGELQIKGPWISRGHHNQGEARSHTVTED